MMKPQLVSLEFSKKVQITGDVWCFYFERHEFDYIAGQYVQITLPHENSDDRGTSRFFTIASSPTEKDLLMITSRKGTSSFKKALFGLAKGTAVQVFGPMGTFVLLEV